MHVARQIHTGTRASGPFVRRIEGTWWRQDWQDFQLRGQVQGHAIALQIRSEGYTLRSYRYSIR